MAPSVHLFIILAIVATLAPSISAVEFVVGDGTGWTINFDYQAWAQGKEFHVGDKLGKSIRKLFINSLLIFKSLVN